MNLPEWCRGNTAFSSRPPIDLFVRASNVAKIIRYAYNRLRANLVDIAYTPWECD